MYFLRSKLDAGIIQPNDTGFSKRNVLNYNREDQIFICFVDLKDFKMYNLKLMSHELKFFANLRLVRNIWIWILVFSDRTCILQSSELLLSLCSWISSYSQHPRIKNSDLFQFCLKQKMYLKTNKQTNHTKTPWENKPNF